MNRSSLIALFVLALGGCASRPATPPTTERPGDASESSASAPAVAGPAARNTPTRLSRGLHVHAMTEVVLDASGEAALTLDDHGSLRLWPDLHGAQIDLPVALPEQEPIWISLASDHAGGFVVATIDTTGGARVARVTVDQDGGERLALFELPATDPQFELHVLDGGRRILALGKDHRVRLFDDRGRVVSQIDQRGFTPWQLRVVESPGQAPALAAVLTQPVRAQPLALALDSDRLAIVGEPSMIALDQSPNRNDMALSPDGKTIAALRRPAARGRGFSLQLVELATGKRRLIVGELDTKVRPRLHYASNDRVLLETGSGRGFWVALAQSVPRDSAVIPPAVLVPVPMPDAAGDLRMQVAQAAGVRAIATGDVLTVDRLADAGHRRLQRGALEASSIALDADGARIAWSRGSEVFIDRAAPDGASVRFDAGGPVRAVGFVGNSRLVVVTSGGVGLHEASDGRLLERTAIDSIEFAAIVHDVGGTTMVAVRSAARARPRESRVMAIEGDHVVAAADLESAKVWLAVESAKGAAARQTKRAAASVALLSKPRLAAPAPTGTMLAMVVAAGNLELSDRTPTKDDVEMFDTATGTHLWSAPLGQVDLLAWAAQGGRIALHDGEGLAVRDARSGTAVYRRTDVGLTVHTAAD